MKYRKFSDNRGYSLVELIVVVLIIGVLATGATLSFSIIYNADAERSARKFAAMVNLARSQAMATEGKDSTYIKLKIFIKDGDNYAGVYRCNSAGDEIQEIELDKISNYKVEVVLGPKGSPAGTTKTIAEEKDKLGYVEYRFNKATGGIASVTSCEIETVTEGEDGNILTYKSPKVGTGLSDSLFFVDILFDGSADSKVIIAPATGRCFTVNE